MERTTLGPVEQFRYTPWLYDEQQRDKWFIGQQVIDERGHAVRGGERSQLVAFRLYDSGEIVLVDPSRLEPNVPNPPAFSESAAWREMVDVMERLPG